MPFYFCPRSIMLYILHMGNHPDISYREGQGPIIHLQADLMASIQWAEKHKVRWAFSDRNAGANLLNSTKLKMIWTKLIGQQWQQQIGGGIQ